MSKHLNLVSASPSSLARKFLECRRDFEIDKKTAAMKWETWKTCVSTDKKDEITKRLAHNSPEAHVSVHVVSCQAKERVARVC